MSWHAPPPWAHMRIACGHACMSAMHRNQPLPCASCVAILASDLTDRCPGRFDTIRMTKQRALPLKPKFFDTLHLFMKLLCCDNLLGDLCINAFISFTARSFPGSGLCRVLILGRFISQSLDDDDAALSNPLLSPGFHFGPGPG